MFQSRKRFRSTGKCFPCLELYFLRQNCVCKLRLLRAAHTPLQQLNLSPFYDVIDTFSRRRYFFRKRLRVFQISDLELGVHKRGIVGAVATVFS